MPDFVATLAAAILFCVVVLLLNALTRLTLGLHLAPADLAENGLAQFVPALMVSVLVWRRAVGRRPV